MPRTAKTPGSVLQAKIDEFQLTPSAVARDLGVKSLSSILSGKSGIDLELALRLAKYFGNKPEDWIKIQLSYYKAALAAELKDISKVKKPKVEKKTAGRGRGRKPAADKKPAAKRASTGRGRGRKPAAEKKPVKVRAPRRSRKSAVSTPIESSSFSSYISEGSGSME
jgi:addiction module HigA family antidote